MANKTEHIFSIINAPVADSSNAIATVEAVDQYEATLVKTSNCNTSQVVAHLNNVPPLSVGDKVLVIATPQGIVVTGRLRSKSESPLEGLIYQDGKLCLRAGKSVKIQSGHAQIELTATGKIKIDGKNIYSISEGRHRLQGSTIELN